MSPDYFVTYLPDRSDATQPLHAISRFRLCPFSIGSEAFGVSSRLHPASFGRVVAPPKNGKPVGAVSTAKDLDLMSAIFRVQFFHDVSHLLPVCLTRLRTCIATDAALVLQRIQYPRFAEKQTKRLHEQMVTPRQHRLLG